MTVRVYLAAARFLEGAPEVGDLLAERVFVHAAEVPEVWVETERTDLVEPGRAVAFALARRMDLGFGRITGTVERAIEKGSRRSEPDS